MAKRTISTTVEEELYKKVQILAIKSDKKTNELIEEGMQLVLLKYKDQNRGEESGDR